MNAKQKKVQGVVVVNVPVSAQFCEDVMTTAGYGVNYWAHAFTDPDMPLDTPPGSYAIEEDEASSGKTRKTFIITPQAVVNGIQKILTPGFNVRTDIRETVFGALADDDASNVDNEIADTIVQAAMFGEIVYG